MSAALRDSTWIRASRNASIPQMWSGSACVSTNALTLRNCRGGVDVVDLRRRPGRIDDEGVPVPEDDERVRLPLRRLEPLHAFGESSRTRASSVDGHGGHELTGEPVPGSILSGNPNSVKRLPATASSGPTFSKCVTPSSRQTWWTGNA